jgi:hypothetical protein
MARAVDAEQPIELWILRRAEGADDRRRRTAGRVSPRRNASSPGAAATRGTAAASVRANVPVLAPTSRTSSSTGVGASGLTPLA